MVSILKYGKGLFFIQRMRSALFKMAFNMCARLISNLYRLRTHVCVYEYVCVRAQTQNPHTTSVDFIQRPAGATAIGLRICEVTIRD